MGEGWGGVWNCVKCFSNAVTVVRHRVLSLILLLFIVVGDLDWFTGWSKKAFLRNIFLWQLTV